MAYGSVLGGTCCGGLSGCFQPLPKKPGGGTPASSKSVAHGSAKCVSLRVKSPFPRREWNCTLSTMLLHVSSLAHGDVLGGMGTRLCVLARVLVLGCFRARLVFSGYAVGSSGYFHKDPPEDTY